MKALPVISEEHTPPAAQAFTLVEMMVSMAVLTMLVLMMTSIFNLSADAWSRSEAASEHRRSDRSLTDFIGEELRGAMLPAEITPPVSAANLQFITNPPLISADYQNADSIFWQAPVAVETTYGDVAEVGYFVKWIQTDPTKPAMPTLCRFFVNPSVSDSGGNVQPNPLFQIYGARTGTGASIRTDPTKVDAWLTNDLLQSASPVSKTSGYLGLFAENVVGLWVRSYTLDNKELPRTYSSRVYQNQVAALLNGGFVRNGGLTCGYVITTGSGKSVYKEPRYLPAVVQISLAQVDSKHAPLLPAAASVLRSIANTATIRDAAQFMDQVEKGADSAGPLRALLPGIRIYSTNVSLDNGR